MLNLIFMMSFLCKAWGDLWHLLPRALHRDCTSRSRWNTGALNNKLTRDKWYIYMLICGCQPLSSHFHMWLYPRSLLVQRALDAIQTAFGCEWKMCVAWWAFGYHLSLDWLHCLLPVPHGSGATSVAHCAPLSDLGDQLAIWPLCTAACSETGH